MDGKSIEESHGDLSEDFRWSGKGDIQKRTKSKVLTFVLSSVFRLQMDAPGEIPFIHPYARHTTENASFI